MLIGVRQQREEARTLDRDRQLALIEGLRARDTARHDLAGLGDIALERRQILVVDRLHAFGGEAAEFLAPREATRRIGFHGLTTPARVIVRAQRFLAAIAPAAPVILLRQTLSVIARTVASPGALFILGLGHMRGLGKR